MLLWAGLPGLRSLHDCGQRLTQHHIAGELYVSINTVRTHCRAIYRMLGVGDRHAAVQAARGHRLI